MRCNVVSVAERARIATRVRSSADNRRHACPPRRVRGASAVRGVFRNRDYGACNVGFQREESHDASSARQPECSRFRKKADPLCARQIGILALRRAQGGRLPLRRGSSSVAAFVRKRFRLVPRSDTRGYEGGGLNRSRRSFRFARGGVGRFAQRPGAKACLDGIPVLTNGATSGSASLRPPLRRGPRYVAAFLRKRIRMDPRSRAPRADRRRGDAQTGILAVAATKRAALPRGSRARNGTCRSSRRRGVPAGSVGGRPPSADLPESFVGARIVAGAEEPGCSRFREKADPDWREDPLSHERGYAGGGPDGPRRCHQDAR